MSIATFEITPQLAEELRAAVAWWRAHGRPELTVPLALREATEDWIAALRAEHLNDGEVPRRAPSFQPVEDDHAQRAHEDR
jgi:hypothetical protein